MKRITRWLQANSLWLVSLGLMVASSGIDGAYMARWIDRIDAKRQGPEVEGQDLVVLTVWLCD